MIAIQPSLFDAPAAQAAAEAGMARAERNADGWWLLAVENAIDQMASSGRVFTSDAIWELVGEPPATTHPNSIGSVFNRLAREGRIVQVGYGKSSRPRSHKNLLRQWRGAAPCAACGEVHFADRCWESMG